MDEYPFVSYDTASKQKVNPLHPCWTVELSQVGYL